MKNLIENCNATIKMCTELKEYCKKNADQCMSKHPNKHEFDIFQQRIQENMKILQQCINDFNDHLQQDTDKKCTKATKETLKKCIELLNLFQNSLRVCDTANPKCNQLCVKSMAICDECVVACNNSIKDSCDLKASRDSKMVFKSK